MTSTSPSHHNRVVSALSSFPCVLFLSIVLRVALILYSEWHDARSVVKYTDVDYRVFSDATHFVLNPAEHTYAEGPLGKLFMLGDPYQRATYRYTPLLALLLAPNEWLHSSFGKYLFAACDIGAGFLIRKILFRFVLPVTRPGDTTTSQARPHTSAATPSTLSLSQYATLLTALHLLNPLVFTISTRGSSEAVLSLFVLLTLYYALAGSWDKAAMCLGLSTHWKIYPFVYGVACLGVINNGVKGRVWRKYVNTRTVRFAFVSAATFAVLAVAMYLVWGYPFVYHSYLYHLHRLDHRHNFAPYFYLIYLTYPENGMEPSSLQAPPMWEKLLRSPLTSFVPQMTLALGSGFLFGRRRDDLIFAWFVQTFTFVIFNKVCTSQYFLWYTLFLPLLVPYLSMTPRRVILCGTVWAGTQALWLSEAYELEFLGQNVYFGLWVRGLVYMVGHSWVLARIMDSYRR